MLTPDTTLQLTLAAGIAIVGALIVATWRAANYLRDLTEEVKGIRAQMAGVWTVNDMERWAMRLERENKTQPLTVPDPLEIRSEVKMQ